MASEAGDAGELFARGPESLSRGVVTGLEGDVGLAYIFAAHFLKAGWAVVASADGLRGDGGEEGGESAFGVGVEQNADGVAED
jgi:hypothetical protein